MKKLLALILSLSVLCSSVPAFASAASKKASPKTTVSTKVVAKKAPSKGSIIITGRTATVKRGNNATVTVKGKANTAYTLSVQYASGKSKATKIGTKTSGTSGIVSWTWKVGTKTTPGQHAITITGGGQTINTSFITTK